MIKRRPTLQRLLILALAGLRCASAVGGEALVTGDSPATQPSQADTRAAPGVGRFEHVTIDLRHRQIRVECEALNVEMPLEFFCVLRGGPEHETVLRTSAKPSAIHFGLLAMGLKPGRPAHFDPATRTWFAPTGPPLDIRCEYEGDGKVVSVPAYSMMRSVKTKQEMPPMTWVFDGSRVLPDQQYAADITGYVVSIVNFDLTMIDVPGLASNSNETLAWEYNPDKVPKKGSPVTMIIEPAAKATTMPDGEKGGTDFNPGPGLHSQGSGS